jgi:hypothetical protein
MPTHKPKAAEVLAAEQRPELACDGRCSEAHSYDEGCVLTVSYSEPSEEVQALSELVAPVMRAWTLDSPFHDSAPRRVAEALLAAGYMHVADRDALKTRVEVLEESLQKMTRQRDAHKSAAADWAAENEPLMERVGNRLVQTRKERDVLLARVDLLTTALTGLVDMQFSGVIHRSSFEHVRREALWENARAVLSVTPTESED